MAFAVTAQILPKIGAVIFVLICLVLIGVILLQKGRGGGLSGAFGGAGGHTAFGAKTGDFLTWTTVVMATAFLLLAVLMNFAYRPPKVVAQTPPGDQTATTQPVAPPAEAATPTTEPAEGMPAPVGPGEEPPAEQAPAAANPEQPVEQPAGPVGHEPQPADSPKEKAEEPGA
jgi:preprotein translocase subunit SecG